NFTWKIVLCLGLVVLAGVVVGLAGYQYATTGGGFKLGVDLVGGTTLVYEVDQDKFSDPQAKRSFEERSTQLAVSLKHRIDPADLYNITVRPAGTWRVEIILPTGGAHQADLEARAWQNLLGQVRSHYGLAEDANLQDVPQGQKLPLVARVHDALLKQGKDESPEAISQFIDQHFTQQRLTSEEVAKVKEKIAQVGSLEFRILANSHDDKAALDAASAYFERAQKDANGPERKALADAAIRGLPPPPPDVNGDRTLPTETNIGSYTYSWVELGRTERQSLGLNNEAAGPSPYVEVAGEPVDQKRHFWHQVAVARGEEKAEPGNENGKPVTRYVKAASAAWEKLLTDVRQEYKLPADADLATGVPAGETDALAARVHDLLRNQKREEPVVAIRKFIDDHYKLETFETVPMPQAGGALLYSRVVPNPSRLPAADRDKKYEYFLLTRDPEKGKEVTGLYLESASRTQDSQMRPAIGFRFNQQGGDRFFDLTSINAPTREGFHRFLAIVLDGQIVSAPSLNARISREGIIEGNFGPDEVDRYVNILNSGALPASLKPVPVSENTIGATLGADTIFWGTVSVLIAFGVVLVFMLIYYRFSGLVACIALLANLLLTVAFMVIVSATFTLPGLAGLVLMLGMAVDANVLIYERLREERERGANLALAIRNGYDRAFAVIIDTHLSSIFTAIVLYAVGNDQLKGFGISLTVGLFISLFTSLFMTRLMFDLCYARGWLKKLGMMRLFHRPNIDFMAIRYYFFTATIALTLIGAALFFARVYNKSGLNIDFVGGTAYTGNLTHPVSITDLRAMLGEDAQKAKLRVTSVEEVGSNGMTYRIQYAGAREPATIDLPNAATPEEIARRASQLP
ncbi:MAG TPA: protein translocase subunit SecD, partial [Gemmataceae bacterium]|nr:protein translocase subunit SecD [Gemmataceae bacterium]